MDQVFSLLDQPNIELDPVQEERSRMLGRVLKGLLGPRVSIDRNPYEGRRCFGNWALLKQEKDRIRTSLNKKF